MLFMFHHFWTISKDVNIVYCFNCNLFTLRKPHLMSSPRCRLTALDELDCSFNEIEALPSSIGQCACIRTFAADHNFLVQLPPEVSAPVPFPLRQPGFGRMKCIPLWPCLPSFTFTLLQMGNWKNATVLFLHSNKLESLPEEMGNMQKLKVINLSNNKWVFSNIYNSLCSSSFVILCLN